MSEKVLLHLGAHRTGTTYLQELFALNSERLEQHEIFFKYFHQVRGLRASAIKARLAAERGRDAEFVKRFDPIRKQLQKLASKSFRKAFISYEGLLGSINLAAPGAIYPATGRIAEEVHAALRGKPVTVGFFVRNYADFIESTFKYCVRSGSAASFERYVKQIDLENVSWLPVMEALSKVFGQDNVLVWSYESFASDREGTARWLFERSGLGDAALEGCAFPQKRANVSASDAALRVERSVNAVLSGLVKKGQLPANLRRKLARAINAKVEASLPVNEHGRPQLFGEDARQALRDRYSAHLDQLRATFGENAKL